MCFPFLFWVAYTRNAPRIMIAIERNGAPRESTGTADTSVIVGDIAITKLVTTSPRQLRHVPNHAPRPKVRHACFLFDSERAPTHRAPLISIPMVGTGVLPGPSTMAHMPVGTGATVHRRARGHCRVHCRCLKCSNASYITRSTA